MASATLTNTVWPSGTTVGVYLKQAQVSGRRVDSEPLGSTVTSAAVSGDRTVTFTGLTTGVEYVASAEIGSAWKSVAFQPGDDFQATGTSPTENEIITGDWHFTGDVSIDSLDDQIEVPILVQAGSLSNQGNSPYWLYRREDTLFVAVTNDGAVKAYDLTTPANPDFLGSVTLDPGLAWIDGYGDYLFVTNQDDLNLKVIDASDPEDMSVEATLSYSSGGAGGGRFAVSPNGQKLFVGGPEDGVNANKAYLIDVATPTSPTLTGMGSIAAGTVHRGVAAIDNSIWAVGSRDDHKAYIISTATAASPSLVTSITLQGTVTTSMNVDGSTLYCGSYGDGYLEAYDVSSPSSPVFLSRCEVPVGIEQTYIDSANDRAYCGCRPSNAIAAIDISSTNALQTLGSATVLGTVTPGVAASEDGDYVYLTAAGDSVNGIIYVFSTAGTLTGLTDAVQGQVASLLQDAAILAQENDFTAPVEISADEEALVLSGSTPAIQFGNDLVQQLSDNNLRADVTLTLLGLVLFNAGAMLRSKTAENNAEFDFILGADGQMDWGGGSAVQDTRLERLAANLLGLGTDDGLSIGADVGTGGNFIQFFEQSADPSAPAANGARLFAKDNGSGKTQLVCRFPSGATQVIATEP